MKYSTYLSWGVEGADNADYDICVIRPVVSPEQEEADGFNYVSRCGSEGASYDVYDSLEKAIIQSHYNPAKIQFKNFTAEQLGEKDRILSNYFWDNENGYRKKVIDVHLRSAYKNETFRKL